MIARVVRPNAAASSTAPRRSGMRRRPGARLFTSRRRPSHQARIPERQIDRERPTPASRLHQKPADRRSETRRDRRGRRLQPYRARPLADRDPRSPRPGTPAPASPHPAPAAPRSHQQRHRRCRALARCQREEDDTQQVELPAPHHVAETAEDDHERCEHDVVGVEHRRDRADRLVGVVLTRCWET